MSEALRGIPEAYQHWKPKRRPQTMADIDRTAKFMQDIHESVERYWEKQAVKEREAVKVPWWVLVLALLGTIVTENTKRQEGQVYP